MANLFIFLSLVCGNIKQCVLQINKCTSFEFLIAFTGILIVICNLFWLTAKSAVLISEGLCTHIKRWKLLIWWLFIFTVAVNFFSFLHWSNTWIQPANNYNIHTAILSLPCLCYCLKLKNDIYINTYIFFFVMKDESCGHPNVKSLLSLQYLTKFCCTIL